MKLILSMLMIITLVAGRSFAQYTQQGKIRYERKVNTYAQLEDDGHGERLERMKSVIPKFKITYFDLSFNMNQSIYKRIKMPDDKPDVYWDGPATENTVFTDFKDKDVTASKLIYEKTFLVKDSMRKLQWKITDEIRTIGDFKCRKAVSRICDSVYVVAFYTTDIVVSGGPEMFSGLPGMILELAIPRLHTTWTATKIEVTAPDPADMSVPTKGKVITEKELYETLKDSFSDWGKNEARNIWWSVL